MPLRLPKAGLYLNILTPVVKVVLLQDHHPVNWSSFGSYLPGSIDFVVLEGILRWSSLYSCSSTALFDILGTVYNTFLG